MKNKVFQVLGWLQMVLIAFFLALLIETYLFGFAVVEGNSMAPTLHGADRLFVTKMGRTDFQVGDIVIFTPPEHLGRQELFVKRVVAKAKDTFVIDGGVVYVNGVPLEESYLGQEPYLERDYPYTMGTVPEGMVFLLGDNRNDSNDSRTFGFVQEEQIVGKVLLRIWPLNQIRAFVGQ